MRHLKTQELCSCAIGVAAAATAAVSLTIAHHDPAYAFAGRSIASVTLELLAGLGLVAVGLEAWRRQRASKFGVLLAAAGVAWFLVEWNNPGAGSPVAFTIGLTLFFTAPPLVAHAALAFPSGRLVPRGERAAVAIAYAGAVLSLGLLPTTVFDPRAAGCVQCPRNLLLASGNAPLYNWLTDAGVRLGLFCVALLLATTVMRVARSTPARRTLTLPVLGAACGYLALVAADLAHSLPRGYLANDIVDRRLWLGQGIALAAVAAAVALSWLRARRTRTAVASLVVEIARSPAPGSLALALAEVLGDPTLQIGYRLADGALVNGLGHHLELSGDQTPLVRGATEIAILGHRPGLLDDPAVGPEIERAARLALDNERLQANIRAQLERLRTSRSRIVETADAERRRLERDLHDGAQQRLVALSLALRLARLKATPSINTRLEKAEAEVHAALAELRELAQGIFPTVLAEEGLAAAIQALAESKPVHITSLPTARTDFSAEVAAYFVVAETLTKSPNGVTVDVTLLQDALRVRVEGAAVADALGDVEDRVGALNGTARLERTTNASAILAEIPCAS